METEATHVTRMKNRRRVIMMIIPGAISQRGIKRTPDEAAINIAQKIAPFTIGTFLRKHKTKVNNERQKQITKFPTHQKEKRGQLNEAASSGLASVENYQTPYRKRYIREISTIQKYQWQGYRSVTHSPRHRRTVCLFSLGRHRRQCS